MADHFTLDVDPAGLRKVAGNLETLRTNVMAKGGTVTGTPGEIGDGWKGDAATRVKAEMETVGFRMTAMGSKLLPIAENLRDLARKYDTGLEALPDLNRRWEAAQTAYDDAVTASEQQRDRDQDALRDEQGRPNRFLQHEIQDGHSNRLATASTTRQNTQDAIQAEYDEIVDQLERDTGLLGRILDDNTPVDVTDEQIEAWQSGSWPEPDMSTLLLGLDLTADRQEQEARDRLTPQVQEDIEALQQALEDGDAEAINEALDAMGEHADDDIYTDILVDELGVEGVQDLYLQLDESLTTSTTDMETLWGSMEGFNDAVANGISQRSDEEMASFVEAWMDVDYGPKMWALVTASDNADGRVNAIAMAYHSEVYNAALSNPGGMSGLYPQAFNYAYGQGADMLQQWADRSSGDDLARVLKWADSEHVEDMMFRLNNVNVDGGTMPEEDYQLLVDLWGETADAMIDQFHEAQANGTASPDVASLVHMLNAGGPGRDPYDQMLEPHLERIRNDVVNDPALMNSLLAAASRGDQLDLEPMQLATLLDRAGADMDDLMERQLQYHLDNQNLPAAAGQDAGFLMRMGERLEADIDWAEVAAGTVQDIALDKLPGPVSAFLGSLSDELDSLAEDNEEYNSDNSSRAAQEVMAFQLYMQYHGAPAGLEDFLSAQEGSGYSDREQVHLYLTQLRNGTVGDDQTRAQMDELFSSVNSGYEGS